MKKILILIGILIFGCRSSPEASFENLNTAFINWYFKYHPVESTRYDIKDNHGKYRLKGTSERDEYYADISRFLIELSQIDVTKISPDAQIDYNILYSRLEKMKYIMDNIRPWEWNALWTIDEIYEGIYILSERVHLEMDNRVNALQSRLEKIPTVLDNSKNHMIAQSRFHISYSNERIDKLIMLLQQLPLKLNSDNITLDNIDRLIEKCVNALNEYKEWMNIYAELDKMNFPEDLHLIEGGFMHYTGRKYQAAPVYKLAEKKLNSTQDRLFNLTLPIYLMENDEPVWLDRADTLEVIQWTIESIRQKPNNKVRYEEILSQFYESISKIEQFNYNQSLIPRKINKTIQLDFAPQYRFSNSHVFLFDYHPKEFAREVIYNIYHLSEDNIQYELTRQEIDIINAELILPGFGVQLAHAQRFPSMIRYLFPDLVTVAGWKAYAVTMLIEQGFGDWGNEYHIFKLKTEISIIVRAIVEAQYYVGEMSREDAVAFLQKMAFMKKDEADMIQLESDLHFFSGTQSFIGMMEMNSLYNEYKRNQGDEFNILEFHRIVLSNGIIPLYELKKQILLP